MPNRIGNKKGYTNTPTVLMNPIRGNETGMGNRPNRFIHKQCIQPRFIHSIDTKGPSVKGACKEKRGCLQFLFAPYKKIDSFCKFAQNFEEFLSSIE
ncbi:hypothetical protein NBH08_03870 [Faecalicatena sp. BF-R-105]|nr:hypothetical protein [Faecalicatena sp. BF-R-105]